jgi:hypothetical protein
MRKKLKLYTRTCEKCHRYFNTESKYSTKCEMCKINKKIKW